MQNHAVPFFVKLQVFPASETHNAKYESSG